MKLAAFYVTRFTAHAQLFNKQHPNFLHYCIELIRKSQIFDQQITFLRKLFGRWAIFLKNIQQMGVIQVFNNN